MTTDGQESRGDIPYELDHCECRHLETLHAISESSGKRTACSASTCDCRRFVAAQEVARA